MERIIKFRGKRLDNNEWVYGFYAHDPEDGHLIINFVSELTEAETNMYEPVQKTYQVVPETVGQLIRIKETIEFFEGDFVSYGLMKGLGEPARHGLYMDLKMFSFTGWETKVRLLGNIHDDPEIINKYVYYPNQF